MSDSATQLAFAIRAINEASKVLREVEKDLDKLGVGADQSSSQVGGFGASLGDITKTAAGVAAGLVGVQVGVHTLRSAFTSTIGAAIDFESSFAGVRKTVNGSEAQLQAIASGFREMAKEIPVNVNELNAIGEAAGQLGIKTENIVQFSRVMADLGVTTNLASDEAASALAQLANITQMPQTEFDRLGSTIVGLGNNLATTERDIVEFGLRIAGAGEIAGLTEADILSIGAAMSSVGVEAEAGGTAVQKVLLSMTEAVATGNDDLLIFAQTAGMSAQEFARAWETDAAGAFVQFVEGIGAAGTEAFQILDDLDMTDQRLIRSFLSLAGAGDLLAESIALGNEQWDENTALAKEAEQRYGTTASELQILRNNINDVGITIGSALLPMVADASGAFAGMVNNLDTMAPILLPIATGIGAIVAGMAVYKVVEFADALGKAAVEAASLRVALVGGAVAGIAALDFALREITGSGVLGHVRDFIKGTDFEAQGAAEAVDDLVRALAGLQDPGQRVAAVQAEIARAAQLADDALRRQSLSMEDVTRASGISTQQQSQWLDVVQEAGRDLDLYTGKIRELFGALETEGATLEQVRDLYYSLTPELQAVAYETDIVKEAFAAATNQTQDLEAALYGSADGVGGLTSELPKVVGPANDAANSIGALWDDLGEVAKNADEAAKKIGILTGVLVEQHPTVLANNAQIALNNIEIAKLEAKTGDLTAAEEARLEALQDANEAMEAQNEVVIASGEALDPWIAKIAGLTGQDAGSLADLAAQLGDAGVSVEDLAEMFSGPIHDAFFALENDDLPGAIEAIRSMRDELDPEEWRTLLAGLPDILAEGVRDSMTAEVLAAIDELAGSIMSGIASGLYANKSVAEQEMDRRMLDIMAAGAMAIQSHSPSKIAAEMLGLPIMQGIAMGIERGKDEPESALESFLSGMLNLGHEAQLIKDFGDLGAAVLLAYGDAIDDNSDAAGAKLARALDDLFQEFEDAGQPLSEAEGRELMEYIANGIRLGTPEALAAVEEFLGELIARLDTIPEAIQLTADTFGAAWADIVASDELLERIGRDGVALSERLRIALEEGGEKNIAQVAKDAKKLREKLMEELPPAQGAYIGSLFMDALNTVIATKGEEGWQQLERILAIANQVLQDGAIDIRSGTVIIGDDIEALADRLGIEADTIRANIQTFVDSGLFTLLDSLGTFTDENQAVVDDLVEAWEDGALSLGELVANIIALINGIPVSIPGLDIGGGGSGGGSTPGTGGGSARGTIGIPQVLKEAMGMAMATGGVGAEAMARDRREAEDLVRIVNAMTEDMRSAANIQEYIVRRVVPEVARFGFILNEAFQFANGAMPPAVSSGPYVFNADDEHPDRPSQTGMLSTWRGTGPGGSTGTWYVDTQGQSTFIPDEENILGAGGITRGPMRALIGDNPSGIEAVIPLERADEFGFGGGPSVLVEVNLQAWDAQSVRDAMPELVRLLEEELGRRLG